MEVSVLIIHATEYCVIIHGTEVAILPSDYKPESHVSFNMRLLSQFFVDIELTKHT